MDAVKLLEKQVKETSQAKVATELGISKATVSLLLKGKYPKPEKMHEKIISKYGGKVEIIGASCKAMNLEELAKEVAGL